MRTAGRYLGAWGAIASFVALVSFTFTFLGTITCAVLVGMMLGAFKEAKWFSVPVSLVFPAAILGMTRSAQAALTPQQIFLLVVVCFGTFWGTYLVSALVFFCEQKDRKSSNGATRAPQQHTLAQAGRASETRLAPTPELAGAAVPAVESCLEQLQGEWVCEASDASAPAGKKVIRINGAKLELKATDVSGRITLLARGEVTLQSLRPS